MKVAPVSVTRMGGLIYKPKKLLESYTDENLFEFYSVCSIILLLE